MIRIEARGRDLGVMEAGIGAGPGCGEPLVRDRRRSQQLPAARHDAEQFEQRYGTHRHAADILVVGLHHVANCPLQCVDGAGQCRGDFGQIWRGGRRRGGRRPHLSDHGMRRAAAVACEFAADQIVGLNSGGALINRCNACIAEILCGACLLDESDAAVNLYSQRSDVHGILGAPAFDHGNHEIGKGLMTLPFLRARVQAGGVQRHCDHGGERPHGFGLRLHEQQHTAHVGMVDDGHAGAAAHAGLGALDSFARIGECRLVGALRNTDAFHAHRKPGRVHHDEHVLESAVFLADELAQGAAVLPIGEHAGGAGMDSQLALYGYAMNVVVRACGAVVIDQELRHHEQRNAFDPFRCSGDAPQNQVNDVVRQVVIAVCDEDLLSLQPVAAVAGGHGSRAYRGQVGAGLRLREIHGPRPLAAHQLREVGILERVRSSQLDGVDRAACQHGAQRKGHVGAVPHLLDQCRQGAGQILTAELRRAGQRSPAVGNKTGVCLLPAVGRQHLPVLPARALHISALVERRQHAAREFGGFVQHRLRHVQ